MTLSLPAGVQINAPILPGFETILTEPALALVAKLHRAFEPRRQELLAARAERAKRLDAGERPDFLAETEAIRDGDWKIAPVPPALQCRRVEITGPVDAKMVINAFNSGADSYMTDFEDSNSPLWTNQIQGQINIGQAIRRTLSFEQEIGGRQQELQAQRQDRDAAGAPARLAPRREARDRSTASASPAASSTSPCSCSTTRRSSSRAAPGRTSICPSSRATSRRGCGTTSSSMTQNELGLPQGTIKATVLIETILAAFEMDEILYELREHSAGLNAGRWDYIFSCIKKFKPRPGLLPRRPRQGDDDRAVHARLRAAAAADLPPARRAGDRRHERADPDQERSGQERDRDGRHHRRQAARRDRRLRRRLGRAPGPGRGVDEGVRRRPRRPAEPVRQAEARGPRQRRRPARLPARDADHRGRACA